MSLEIMLQQLQQTAQLQQEIAAMIEQISDRLSVIEQGAKPWLNKHEAAALLNVDETTLALYRRTLGWSDGSFAWVDGIHYHKMPIVKSRGTGRSTGSYEYNRELLLDWQINRLDWAAHQRAIDLWVKSVKGNKKRAS